MVYLDLIEVFETINFRILSITQNIYKKIVDSHVRRHFRLLLRQSRQKKRNSFKVIIHSYFKHGRQ
jgi:hypothetical protein